MITPYLFDLDHSTTVSLRSPHTLFIKVTANLFIKCTTSYSLGSLHTPFNQDHSTSSIPPHHISHNHFPLYPLPFPLHTIMVSFLYSPPIFHSLLVKNTGRTQTSVTFSVSRLDLGSSIFVVLVFSPMTSRSKDQPELHGHPLGLLGISFSFDCLFWLFVCKPLRPFHGLLVQEPSHCRCLCCHGISVLTQCNPYL